MFSKLIKAKKTFFLNGTWGSGKTECLNMAIKQKKKFYIFKIVGVER